jgi:hypothetical protein
MSALVKYLVPLAFLVAAALFFLDPLPFASPVAARVEVPAWVVDPAPVRQPKLQPLYTAAGFTYQCMDCHRIIPSPGETLRSLTQHTEILLNHGINTRCFNCHHLTNRNAFVDDFGNEIPWDQPQLLCSKCHGPVYRDWQAGSHGRINGYWDPARGPQTKRRCIECHDPHAPPFQTMRPAPGPNTLRMGTREAPAHEGRRDPLRVFLRATSEDAPH